MDVAMLDTLAPYVTWLALALVLAVVGQVAKQYASEYLGGRLAKLFRSTLPLHPVVAGGLFGSTLLLPLPEGAGSTRLAGAIYYAASGICCTWVYDLIRSWAKGRCEVSR